MFKTVGNGRLKAGGNQEPLAGCQGDGGFTGRAKVKTAGAVGLVFRERKSFEMRECFDFDFDFFH